MKNIAGNYYDKFSSSNPIVGLLMKGFLENFYDLIAASGARSVYEFGCGEGNLLLRMARLGMHVSGSDISPEIVREANNLLTKNDFDAVVNVGSVYQIDQMPFAPDLIVCSEVLEHLEWPEKALDSIANLSCPYLLVSVPKEPIWRILNMMRGAYVNAWGNTPGHIQHFSRRTLIALLERNFEVLDIRAPLPWIMVLCRLKSGAANSAGVCVE